MNVSSGCTEPDGDIDSAYWWCSAPAAAMSGSASVDPAMPDAAPPPSPPPLPVLGAGSPSSAAVPDVPEG
ncbi:hypothetical protein [Dactylosporangium darangshiense]|uniref:hypothetical protein n=1 Tax=Dactylosporangium darangshiense TaxID=579108 RepID=UPI00364382C6